MFSRTQCHSKLSKRNETSKWKSTVEENLRNGWLSPVSLILAHLESSLCTFYEYLFLIRFGNHVNFNVNTRCFFAVDTSKPVKCIVAKTHFQHFRWFCNSNFILNIQFWCIHFNNWRRIGKFLCKHNVVPFTLTFGRNFR